MRDLEYGFLFARPDGAIFRDAWLGRPHGKSRGQIWLQTFVDSVANVGGGTHEPVSRCPLNQISAK